MKNKGHSPILIAQYLFNLTNRSLTLIQLNKLPYIAHGFCLAIEDRPLSNEEPEAWQYGPVFRSVFFHYKKLGVGFLIDKETAENNLPSEFMFKYGEKKEDCFSEMEKKIINSVFKSYEDKCGWHLSDLTHQLGSPWHTIWNKYKGISGHKIPDKIIKTYYKQQLNEV